MYISSVWDVLLAISDLTFIFKPKTKQAVPNIVRLVESYDLSKKGINLNYGYVSEGLYKRPYMMEFGSYLKDFSGGSVDIEAVNTYVLGDFHKLKGYKPEMKNISNIYDPFCVYKDVWFGVYVVFDDAAGKGRKYVLKKPAGNPADCGNFNPDALSRIPELDQKIVTWSSHQGESGYTRKVHDKKFYFDLQGKLKNRKFNHKDREWLDTFGSFDTWSIIPDVNKTHLKLFSSNRGITGLPDENVYKYVTPWNDITFHGVVRTSYFDSKEMPFWAVVYYGASEYKLLDGTDVNNWTDAVVKEFEKMFSSLEISSDKPAAGHERYHQKKYDRYWIPI